MKTRLLIYMCVTLVLTASCTKSFDDINTNPHQLTDEELANDYQNVGAFSHRWSTASSSSMMVRVTVYHPIIRWIRG